MDAEDEAEDQWAVELRLLHYTVLPLERVRDTGYVDCDDKPIGLWVSVEGPDDWNEWCEREGFADLSKEKCYQINLAPEANILHISDLAAFDAFNAEFNGPGPGFNLDWETVMDRFDGVIIAPYFWERRNSYDARWYYTWDCASGCIWRARAIESVELVQRAVASSPLKR